MTQKNQVTLKIGANAGAAISAFSAIGVAAGNMVFNVLGKVKRLAFALPNAVQEALNTADQMVKRSQVAGMSTEEFSALMHVAKLSGVQMGELEMAARHAARMHNTTLGPALLATARDMEGMTDEVAKLAMAQHRFGRSGTALLPILNQGSKAIREQLGEAKELNNVISTEFGKKAEFFNDTLERIRMSFKGWVLVLAESLLPHLQKFADKMLEISKSKAVELFFKGLSEGFDMIVQKLKDIAESPGMKALLWLRREGALSSNLEKIARSGMADPMFNGIRNRVGSAIANTLFGRDERKSENEQSDKDVRFKPAPGTKVVIEVPKEQAQSAFTTRGFLSAGEASLANRQLAWQNVVAGLLSSIDKNIDRYLPKLEEQEI